MSCRSLNCANNDHCNGVELCRNCLSTIVDKPLDKQIGGEHDPSGIAAHEAGAKLDAGKLKAGLVFGDFAKALKAVCEVGTFGANKYSDSGWLSVDNAARRYEDAKVRHMLERMSGVELDSDSGLPHLAHEAWNALAILELALRKE